MQKHEILITGGCGFVGTQLADTLHRAGYVVTVVDRAPHNLLDPAIEIVEAEYLDYLRSCTRKFHTVIHLAADHEVERSILEPDRYYENNVIKLKGMLDRLVELDIKQIIFSSTGSIYGKQGNTGLPLAETVPADPENTYADTKLCGELLIKGYARAFGLGYVIFRYFNVAGADPAARFGYRQQPSTHVMPILCRRILNEEPFHINGSDYNTVDGTCVRDYVHVHDIATAHISALEFFNCGHKNEIFNLGGYDSTGVTVRQLADYASEVVGKPVNIVYNGRRAGDSVFSVADRNKALLQLNWSPRYTVQDAILHAWNWETKNGR